MGMTQRQMEYMSHLQDKKTALARMVGEAHARDLAHVAMSYAHETGAYTDEVLDKMLSMAMSGKHWGQIKKAYEKPRELCQKPASVHVSAVTGTIAITPERRWKPRIRIDGRA